MGDRDRYCIVQSLSDLILRIIQIRMKKNKLTTSIIRIFIHLIKYFHKNINIEYQY